MKALRKQPSGGSQKKVAEAIKYLKDAQEELTLTGIAAILDNAGEHADRTTIHRWLVDKATHHKRTEARIMRAEAVVRKHRAKPPVIRFAVIKHATEMLPIHLLKNLKLDIREGVTVVVNDTANSVGDLFKLLAGNEVDMIIAPRRVEVSEAYADVKRFFRVALIKVKGMFPVTYESPQQLADEFKSLRQKIEGFAIGCLPNADYRLSLQDFLRKYGGAEPETKVVRDYYEAFEMLRAGQIHGIMGHPVFIENCNQLVEDLRASRKASVPVHFQKLQMVRENIFDDVRMDAFVNLKEISPTIARRALLSLIESVKSINENRFNTAFTTRVSEILNLSKAPAKAGEEIVKEYSYEIKTFETETLVQLWK